MAVIAPFWATNDMYFAFRAGHSKVYYQVYEKAKESSFEILSMASKHVRLYDDTGKFSNFEATWVLVVTWENLCPYVYYDTGIPKLNCPWVSIFLQRNISFGRYFFDYYNYFNLYIESVTLSKQPSHS